jgi:hypothetical protein
MHFVKVPGSGHNKQARQRAYENVCEALKYPLKVFILLTR